MTLQSGSLFPTEPVQSMEGPVDLSSRWAQGPLIVAFHRLWCPFCREAMIQLERARDALRTAGADAVVVYREDPPLVSEKCRQRGVSFDCLSDPDRGLERAAGVERFKLGRYAAFSPLRLGQALRSGGRPAIVKGDLLQGRATYVVDTDGRIAYSHVSETAADIPPIDELVAAATAASATPSSPAGA